MMLKQDFKPVACLPIMVCRDYVLSAVCASIPQGINNLAYSGL